ncbi:hypothetical protein GGR51DRAFT_530564 [Nemania sp. FL0031]|nr:hypothetical protein GGR51DRAFT_530564 [Nemania sp. FL0031]
MFRRFLIFWTIIIILWTITFSIIHFAECGDHLLALFSQTEDYTRYCKVSIHSGWAYVGTDIFTDVVTLIIPIPVILRLNMSRQMKVLSLLVFSIGTLSVGASTVKAYIYISATLNRYTEDAILILTGFSIWNLAEIQIGIIAACGPVLRAIAIKLVPTESISSLIGSWRMRSKQSSKPSSLGKNSGSDERLQRGSRSDGEAERTGNNLPSYELEQRKPSDV